MRTFKKVSIRIADHFALIVISSVIILPFVWMITTSLKPPKLAFAAPYLIPTHFHWQNFVNAWHEAPFSRYYVNSIIVAVLVTFGQVFTSALAAYAFDRFEFPLKKTLWFTLLASMMVPLPLLVIPSFQIIQHLHWADNLAALIIRDAGLRLESFFSVNSFIQFRATLMTPRKWMGLVPYALFGPSFFRLHVQRLPRLLYLPFCLLGMISSGR
jgi:multiple sugar transport system permease protein